MLVPLLSLMFLCRLGHTGGKGWNVMLLLRSQFQSAGAALPKIVNGTDASEGEFPFAVSLTII